MARMAKPFQFRLSTMFWLMFVLPACWYVNPFGWCPRFDLGCYVNKSLHLTVIVILSYVLKRRIEKLGRRKTKEPDEDSPMPEK